MNEDLNLVCVGKFASPHGIKGAIKIKSYTEIPEALEQYSPLYSKTGDKTFHIKIISFNKDMLIAKIDGINNRNDASFLCNKEVYADKNKFSDAEEGEFYYNDLKGLTVKLANNEEFGIIITADNYGSGDVVEIKLKENGRTELFAFTKKNFPEINVGEGFVTINPPKIEYIQDNDN